MTQSLFLGIDIGTSSSKAVLVDATGRIIDQTRRDHQISMPQPGWAEFDAAGVGWPEVSSMCRELVSRHDPASLQGLTISAMGPCLIVTAEDLVPLRPTILYGVDSRAGAEIDELTAVFGAEEILHRCGKSLSSQAIGPKLRWIATHEPEVFARATHWFSLSSWFVARLTGAYVLDHNNASQTDPLYDIHRQDWDPERVQAVAGHLEPPALAWPADVVGAITAEAAAETGLPAGLPVCAGTVDAWAEAHSAGIREPGDVMIMYGSTLFFVQVVDQPVADPAIWTTAGVATASLTLAAGMATSGSLTTWLQQLMGDVPFDTLIAEAAASPPGANGLLVLPYFAGERSPIFDPDARGTITGLTLRHTRGDVFRAGYEGIGYGVRQILDQLAAAATSHPAPAPHLVAVGGGTQSELWMQIVSDITGREQLVPEVTIGASYGDAWMAATGTGSVDTATDWTRTAAVVRPDPATGARYRELFALYASTYPALREQMHGLSAYQKG